MTKEMLDKLNLDEVNEELDAKGVGDALWCEVVWLQCVASEYGSGDPCGLWRKYCT